MKNGILVVIAIVAYVAIIWWATVAQHRIWEEQAEAYRRQGINITARDLAIGVRPVSPVRIDESN